MVALGDDCGLLPLIGLLIQNRPVKGLARGLGPSVRQTRLGCRRPLTSGLKVSVSPIFMMDITRMLVEIKGYHVYKVFGTMPGP